MRHSRVMVDVGLHIQRESYRAYLDEEVSPPNKKTTRDAQVKTPFVCGRLESGVGFWRSRAHLPSTNQGQSDSSKRVRSWVRREYSYKNVSERENDLKYKAVVWLVDGDQLVRCSSTHLRPVWTAEQTLCSLRDGEGRTFQLLVQELPKRSFVDLVGQSSPVEEDFEEPMDVASSDNELHEEFPFR